MSYTIIVMKNKIVRRCKWCIPAHRMDRRGRTIKGKIEDSTPGVIFTDGICSKAEKKLWEGYCE